MTSKKKEALEATVRTLKLLEGYLSTQKADTLLAWEGGMMTWGELIRHAKGARRNLVAAFGAELPRLSRQRP